MFKSLSRLITGSISGSPFNLLWLCHSYLLFFILSVFHCCLSAFYERRNLGYTEKLTWYSSCQIVLAMFAVMVVEYMLFWQVSKETYVKNGGIHSSNSHPAVLTRVNRFMQEVSRLILTGASFLDRKWLLLQEIDYMKSLFSKVTESMHPCYRSIEMCTVLASH